MPQISRLNVDYNSQWWWQKSKWSKRKELLKALGPDRNFLCIAADVYRSPNKRHSFSKWKYQRDLSNTERSIYLKKTARGEAYVISFRGTSCVDDTWTNVKLVMGSFFESSRFQRDLEFVEHFKKHHPQARIVLVGHSLGGRLASEIAKLISVNLCVTFNEARTPRDIATADNHTFIRRYRTGSDWISGFGVIGPSFKKTHFKKLPGHGHAIKKLQRLICRKDIY